MASPFCIDILGGDVMNEFDLAKIRAYVEKPILSPMNIQEQKALCRLLLNIYSTYPEVLKTRMGAPVVTND